MQVRHYEDSQVEQTEEGLPYRELSPRRKRAGRSKTNCLIAQKVGPPTLSLECIPALCFVCRKITEDELERRSSSIYIKYECPAESSNDATA